MCWHHWGVLVPWLMNERWSTSAPTRKLSAALPSLPDLVHRCIKSMPGKMTTMRQATGDGHRHKGQQKERQIQLWCGTLHCLEITEVSHRRWFLWRFKIRNLQSRFHQSLNMNLSMGFQSGDLLDWILNCGLGSGLNPVLEVQEPDCGQSTCECWIHNVGI